MSETTNHATETASVRVVIAGSAPMKALREHSKVRSSAKIAKYMKGGSATDCRADGGTVKAKRPTQSAPITVEGKAARPRLDRPMRKRADGGEVSDHERRRQESLKTAAGAGAATGLGLAGALVSKSRPGRLLSGALMGYGAARTKDSISQGIDLARERREAEDKKD